MGESQTTAPTPTSGETWRDNITHTSYRVLGTVYIEPGMVEAVACRDADNDLAPILVISLAEWQRRGFGRIHPPAPVTVVPAGQSPSPDEAR